MQAGSEKSAAGLVALARAFTSKLWAVAVTIALIAMTFGTQDRY